MKKTHLLLSLLFLCATLTAQVGIGTSSPDNSSILDIQSTDHGMLIPRMTSAQRNLITDPANGLIIYNTDSDEIQFNSNSMITPIWQAVDTRPASNATIGQSIKYSNTDITTDVNVTPAINAPILGTLEWNDNTTLYTVNTGTNTITINETGRYKVVVNVSVITGGTADRLSPEIRIIQASNAVGAYSATGYIRTKNGHQESSLHLTEVLEITTGETISVSIQGNANINANATNDVTFRETGASNIYIEKIM